MQAQSQIIENSKSEDVQPLLSAETETFTLKAFVTGDKLKAFVECQLKKDGDNIPQTNITVNDLVKLLAPKLPRESLQENILADIVKTLNSGKDVERRRVAKGKSPDHGRDGRLVLLLKKHTPPAENKQIEYVDARFIRTFDNIEKGTVIGRIYPPKPGTDGLDVFQKPLKAQTGKPAVVKIDSSIERRAAEIGEQFETLIAQTAGYLGEEKGVLSVRPELILADDVDFKSGDIDFVGKVTINGNIMTNFKVIARENIVVNGNVQSGAVTSKNGDITISGCITGDMGSTVQVSSAAAEALLRSPRLRTRPRIRSAGTVSAEMMMGAFVETEGNITVKKEIRDSYLHAKGLILAPDGHIFGGSYYTACGIEAKTIGTSSGALTELFICSDVESSAEYIAIKQRLDTLEDAEKLIRLNLGPFGDNPSEMKKLPQQYKQKIEELLRRLLDVLQKKEEILQERDSLLSHARKNTVFRVNIHGSIYPGVIIRAGQSSFEPETEIKGPVTIEYLPDSQTFVVGQMKSLECVILGDRLTNKGQNKPMEEKEK